MYPRTNFDVIDIKSNKTWLEVRQKDCFGPLTNSTENLNKAQNSIVRYYLPEYFTSFTTNGISGHHREMAIRKIDYNDKLIFTDDQIQLYTDWLNTLGIDVKRIDDTYHGASPYGTRSLEEGVSEQTRCITLDINLSSTTNNKQRKFALFMTRYLINNLGHQILKRAFDTVDKFSDVSMWDAFLMNEFVESFINRRYGYLVFGTCGLFRYFTFEEYNKQVLLEDTIAFNINTTYCDSDLLPYTKHYSNGINNTEALHDIGQEFKRERENMNDLEFLTYWKQYDWNKNKDKLK